MVVTGLDAKLPLRATGASVLAGAEGDEGLAAITGDGVGFAASCVSRAGEKSRVRVEASLDVTASRESPRATPLGEAAGLPDAPPNWPPDAADRGELRSLRASMAARRSEKEAAEVARGSARPDFAVTGGAAS
jgi:hypothetical protein